MKKQIYLRVIIGLLLIAGLVFAYASVFSEPEEPVITSTQKTRFMMDTAVEIRAIGIDSAEAVDQAFAEIGRIEQLFSRHLSDSEISSINNQAGNWVTVSPEVIQLIETSLEYCKLSDGAFDITLGNLIELWDFGANENYIPNATEIEAVLIGVDYNKVSIDKERNAIKIPSGSMIDLGGIAKGYAVDRSRNVLRDAGIEHAMIFGGGDIATIGTKGDGSPWRVGIQDPRESTQLLGIIPLINNTIVTSGDYERFFIKDGVRFHHILDPHTGYPARDVISVTIVADFAADGDALSTAVFVLGRKAGLELVESLAGFEAVIVDDEGEIWVSSGLKNIIVLL